MERDHSNRSQGQPWQNGGNGSDGGYSSMPAGRGPGSPALSYRERGDRDRDRDRDRERTQDRDRDRSRELERGRDRDMEPRRSAERKHSQQGSSRTASGQVRICKKCGEQLTGQFVRALDGTFHLDCFRCQVRFFPFPRLVERNPSRMHMLMQQNRIVVRLSRPSSSQPTTEVAARNTRFAKRTTSGASASFATIAAAPSEDRTLPH